jgi:hypothetical protein
MIRAKKPLTVNPNDAANLLETVSGKLVNPTDPSADDICLEDIAWGLSRIPRFAGHTTTAVPYNVAQHSIYVSELVELAIKNGADFAGIPGWDEALMKLGASIQHRKVHLLMHALFHDAHETYLGDIPSPIKRVPELRETYKLMEQKFDHAIRQHLGFEEMWQDEKDCVHFFDKLAQAIEGYQFMRSRGLNWNVPTPTLQLLQRFPAPMTAIDSYRAFLERYEYLDNQ